MQNDDLQRPIWGCRPLPAETTKFLDFKYDAPPEPLARPDHHTSVLLQAQKLYDQGDFQGAADALDGIVATDDLARRLLLDCLGHLGDKGKIISRFDPPVSPTETICLMDALWSEGKRDRLRGLLAEPIVAASTDPSVVELRVKYSARLKK
jgi:hypothetical protein